jgi:hypothetical protein
VLLGAVGSSLDRALRRERRISGSRAFVFGTIVLAFLFFARSAPTAAAGARAAARRLR